MKLLVTLIVLLVAYVALSIPVSHLMEQRQTMVKLGYVPSAKAISIVVGDQKLTVAALYSLKAIIYFGEMITQWKSGNRQHPEFNNLFQLVHSSVMLDPYNMDNYYFAQASFTWGVDMATDVNHLLEYGMIFRHWDWRLPYYAGFNAAYFLHDNSTAAVHMGRAAELSGNNLLSTLTSRYLHTSGRTALAIGFLVDMIDRTRDKKIAEQLMVRKQALEAILMLERAVAEYEQRYQIKPNNIKQLVLSGVVSLLPNDPYGGSFYLDNSAKVQTTSRLSFTQKNRNDENTSDSN